MRLPKSLAFIAVIALGTGARGDGLIYKLPENGSQVRYDIELEISAGGQQQTSKGSLTVGSVGEAIVDGAKCRWIELKTALPENGVEKISLTKVLIPEEHLSKGKSPAEKMIRAWHKEGDMAAAELKDLKDPRAMSLAAYLSGPLQNSVDLDKAEIDNPKLGKLNCAGVSGSLDLDGPDGTQFSLQIENRLHDKSPFGVVSGSWKFQLKANGQTAATGTLKLTLGEINTTALTELPDKN